MRPSVDSKICVSISEPSIESCMKELQGRKLAEIRFDRMSFRQEDVKRIFSSPAKLVATFRPGTANDETRLKTLVSAIEFGAAFVDIELESDSLYKKRVREVARERGCKVIVSYHNHRSTPKADRLRKIIDACFESGADIAKIACFVNSEGDNVRLLSMLSDRRSIIVVGMGSKGAVTRIATALLGSPFTYASASTGKETAPGQINFEKMKRLIRSME